MKTKLWKIMVSVMVMAMTFGMTVYAAPAKQQTVQGMTPDGVVSIFQSTSGKTVTIRGYNGFVRTYTVPDYTVLPERPEEAAKNGDGLSRYNLSLSYSENVNNDMAAYRDLAVASLQELLFAGMNDDYTGRALFAGSEHISADISTSITDTYLNDLGGDMKTQYQKEREAYNTVFTSRGVSPIGSKIVAVSVGEYFIGFTDIHAYCVDSTGQPFTMYVRLKYSLDSKVFENMYATNQEYREKYDALMVAKNSESIDESEEPFYGYERWLIEKNYEKEQEYKKLVKEGSLTANDFCYGALFDKSLSLGWTGYGMQYYSWSWED